VDLLLGERKLRLYAPVKNVHFSACHHYRVYTPFEVMKRYGLADYLADDLAPRPDGHREDDMAYADIHQYYLNITPAVLDRINHLKGHRYLRDKHGLFRTPPRTVFDADDSIQHTDVFNPRFTTLGSELPDGRKIEPGCIIHAEDSEGHIGEVWRDENDYPDGYFSVAQNMRKQRIYKMIIRAVSGCTVSNERLAKIFRGYGAKNVHVYPNCIMEEDYPQIRVRRPSDHVRILWQGGYSHFTDWNPLKDALAEVFRARPKARLVVWGMLFPGHHAIPKKQLEFIPWDRYGRFTFRLATIGHHINLAPLKRNTFNDCKTPIKWIESSAITTPAATLAADGPVYGGDAIKHGETGLLYETPEQFTEYLIELIDDASLRQKLAKRAHEDVWDRYEAGPHVKALYRWYLDLREKGERDVLDPPTLYPF